MPRRRRARRAGALAEQSPLKILRQISLLQIQFYLSATVLICFTALVAGKPLSVDLLLGWNSVRGDTTVGWTLGIVWLMNSVVTVIGLLLIVSRSKLILDFALTIHFLHLCATTLYSKSLPRNALWWALQAASAALMTSLGVWSCRRRELLPISFGGNNGGREARNSPGVGLVGNEDVEEGAARKKKGGEGGGYELIGMKDGRGEHQ